MTPFQIALGFLIYSVVTAIMAFYWGYTFAQDKYFLGDISKYLNVYFPDKWAAYKQGVHEGYEQGLRDGQEVPSESA